MRALKTCWHVGLAVVGFYEMFTAETDLRRMLAGAAGGWHTGAAINDWIAEDVRPNGN